MLTNRIFRLFVSSTFSDFIAERAALQKRVFPKLEELCRERGATFQAVDLRWGITEEAQRDHDTMRICLEEVRRCQKLSPRPNFAVLLGDRYGWEPPPARIPQEHWKKMAAVADPADWTRIEASYELDENAVPPVFCLRKRADDHAAAFHNETQLLQALRRSAKDFFGDARLPYFASATHQEIALGALATHDEHNHPLSPEMHVHIYVRRLQGLPNDATAKDFIDWDTSEGQPSPEARDRLRALEDQLRRQLGSDRVHNLGTSWEQHGRNGAEDEAYLKRFCDAFLKHQIELISAELGRLEHFDDREKRERAHQDFGAERARVFAGRKALLNRITRYTADKKAKSRKLAGPLILLGSGGSGKSALLARAAKENQLSDGQLGTIVLQRYIGGVPGTESLMTMLTALTADIASCYEQPQPPVPVNAEELTAAFHAALGYACADRPLILFLDSLDQLDSIDSAWMLDWLPSDLPEHVRIVASARTDTSVEESAVRRYPRCIIEVPPMRPAEGKAMLRAWLEDKRAAWFNAGIAPSKGRRLTAIQEQAVLNVFNTNGSALWLKLAYEEAATWHSYDKPGELPHTVKGLIEDLINRRLLSREKHPVVFTRRALAYITASRVGISALELGRVLGTDTEVRAEFRNNEKTERKWEDAKALPPILWSRLYWDLQPYMGLSEVDGALLMRWFHREFSGVLETRYLAIDQERQRIHGALADTFHELERELRPNESSDDSLFKATDASGKQVSAALRRVMEQPWHLAQADNWRRLSILLSDFPFCLAKCAANQAPALVQQVRELAGAEGMSTAFREWSAFLSRESHLLARGDRRWPGHRILLQRALDHPVANVPQRLAREFLVSNSVGFVVLRRVGGTPQVSVEWGLDAIDQFIPIDNGRRAICVDRRGFRIVTTATGATVREWLIGGGIVKLSVSQGDSHYGIITTKGELITGLLADAGNERRMSLPILPDDIGYVEGAWVVATRRDLMAIPFNDGSPYFLLPQWADVASADTSAFALCPDQNLLAMADREGSTWFVWRREEIAPHQIGVAGHDTRRWAIPTRRDGVLEQAIGRNGIDMAAARELARTHVIDWVSVEGITVSEDRKVFAMARKSGVIDCFSDGGSLLGTIRIPLNRLYALSLDATGTQLHVVYAGRRYTYWGIWDVQSRRSIFRRRYTRGREIKLRHGPTGVDGLFSGVFSGVDEYIARRLIPLTGNATSGRVSLGEAVPLGRTERSLIHAHSLSGCKASVLGEFVSTVVESDPTEGSQTRYDCDHIVGDLAYLGSDLLVSTQKADILLADRKSRALRPLIRFPWGQESARLFPLEVPRFAATHQGCLRVLDLAQLRNGAFQHPTTDVTLVMDLPQRMQVLTAWRGGGVWLWDIREARRVDNLPDPRWGIRQGWRSACGRYVCLKTSGFTDEEEWVWDVYTGGLEARFSVRGRPVPNGLASLEEVPAYDTPLYLFRGPRRSGNIWNHKGRAPVSDRFRIAVSGTWTAFGESVKGSRRAEIREAESAGARWVLEYSASTPPVQVGDTLIIGDRTGSVHFVTPI